MQIVVAAGGEQHEIDVLVRPEATLGDVASLTGAGIPSETVFVDGSPEPADTPIGEARLVAGSVLALDGTYEADDAIVELYVAAGGAAGATIGVPPGRHVLGSGSSVTIALRTPAVKAQHVWVHVSASGAVDVGAGPAGLMRRMHPGSLLSVGTSLVGFRRMREPSRALRTIPGRRGTIAFNRPPRLAASQPTPAIPLPDEPRPPASRSRMGIAALVVPILFGLTLAIVIHPRMAMFALLGPVMMSAGWLDDKRRLRKFKRTSAQEMEVAAERLGATLDLARLAEASRRRLAFPGMADLAALASGGVRMWERRPFHDDFMQVIAGYGRVRWLPPLERDPATVPAAIRDALRDHGRLPISPSCIGLDAGQVLGVAGQRRMTLPLVRGVISQAATHHGPSDLRIAVVTDHPADWDWVKWLPHTLVDGASGRRLIAISADERSQLVTMLSPARQAGGNSPLESEPLTLLVIDVSALASPDAAGIRNLLGGRGVPVAGLVISRNRDELPSVCTRVAETSVAGLRCSGGEDPSALLVPMGLAEPLARRIARTLSRFDDPDRCEPGAELPAAVNLLGLLGHDPTSPESISAKWRETNNSRVIAAPIGVTEAGPLVVDLVTDGPHALLAGTTGSGKSELLRTLVASLAVTADPEHLTFVLIDYKGGSAFDACARLPHTVGMVTDLDDRLAERALGCLEAELRHRERLLRNAGADDLAAYLDLDRDEPLPRMLIVIDEFAALAKELPDFMDALVDIAARGRSLGVHLLLATQRPAGVIRDNVRANTNMRLALRVQDRADSTDVLGDPGAASIARSQPGRGLVRLGPGELVPFQTALVTGASNGHQNLVGPPFRPFRLAMEQAPFTSAPRTTGTTDSGPTDLDALVTGVVAAAGQTGMRQPRRPWPEPLPPAISRGELEVGDAPGTLAVPLGLVDEPEQQRQRTMWWSPDDGSIAVLGLTGSGTTTTVATLVMGLAAVAATDEVHVYVMDFDAGATAALAALPHVGAVVGASERERQIRLIRHLAAELDLRKAAGSRDERTLSTGYARIVLAVDNFTGFTAAFDAAMDTWVKDMLYRVIAEGPSVGIISVLTGSRQSAVPLAILGTIPNKLVLRMADPLAAATLGLRSVPADMPDGRAIHVATKRDVQIALPHRDGIAAAVADLDLAEQSRRGGPVAIEQLPVEVKTATVDEALTIGDEAWFIPVGIGDTRLDAVGFPLAAGDHILIAGEPRTGRSTTLAGIAEMVVSANRGVTVTAIALRRSPLRDVPGIHRVVTDPADLCDVLTPLHQAPGRHLVLIDDADAVDDPGVLKELAGGRRPDLHVIAAGRRDLKTVYNHWAKDLCRSRIGLWLRPSPGLDGDLWSTPLPRHIPNGLPPGRGYLIGDGCVELVQVAHP